LRETIRLFPKVGVDIFNPDDVRGLRETLRWAQEEHARVAQREADRVADRRERRSRLWSWGAGALTTVLGGLITWATKAFLQ
jgi:hypothetical protein